MVTKKNQKSTDEKDDIEMTVDPYTGELKPVPEDADQFIEVMPEETDDRRGSNYLLNEETSMDSYVADADSEAPAEQAAHYTEDEDVEEEFAERQKLAASGRDELRDELEKHHFLSPELSGGDLDASWQTGNVAGEETVGGSSPTPDQDIVDELGAAAGLSYADTEPLNSDAKILDRDRNRWELNPASADDEEKEIDDEDLEDDLEDLDGLEDLDLEDELDDEEDGEEEGDEFDEELDEDDLENEDDLDQYIDTESDEEDENL